MDFNEPAEASRIKLKLGELIETEIRPLEDGHKRFFGPNTEGHIFDDELK